MINLLLTAKGERLSNPNFGSRLKYILFEPNDGHIIAKIQDTINDAVGEYMSYIKIVSIDVDRFDGGTSTSHNIHVSVTFTINEGAESSAVGIPLTLADFSGELGGSAQQNMNLAASDLAS